MVYRCQLYEFPENGQLVADVITEQPFRRGMNLRLSTVAERRLHPNNLIHIPGWWRVLRPVPFDATDRLEFACIQEWAEGRPVYPPDGAGRSA